MLPKITKIRRVVTSISLFRGLNRSCNTAFSQAGDIGTVFTEFKDMKNMGSDKYPQLSPRIQRSRVYKENQPEIISNILSVNGTFIYIDENGRFTYGETGIQISDFDKSKKHTLVLFGNRVLVFPEKKVITISSSLEESDIEAKISNYQLSSSMANQQYPIYKCSIDKIAFNAEVSSLAKTGTTVDIVSSSAGTTYTNTCSQEVPIGTGGANNYAAFFSIIHKYDLVEDATNMPSQLFVCRGIKKFNQNESEFKKYYNGEIKYFTEISNYYVRIRSYPRAKNDLAVPDDIYTALKKFKKGDVVKLSGIMPSFDNGYKEKEEAPNSYIYTNTKDFEGTSGYADVLNNNFFKLYDVGTQLGQKKPFFVIKANLNSSVPYCGPINIERTMPDDFLPELMIESENRLWTCSSKNNEIYACKQGDCTNWKAYADGISTDSYAVTVGKEGDFTGIAQRSGTVFIFKENWIFRLYGNKPSNYTLTASPAQGVEKGSEKSLVWVGGTLFYKSPDGITAYSPGGQPTLISKDAFGEEEYRNAVGGRCKNKYYVSMQNVKTQEYELFVYDTEKGIWHKEDNTRFLDTTTYNDVLYYIDGNTKMLMCVSDKQNLLKREEGEYQSEGDFEWNAETGDLYDGELVTKSIGKIRIGINLEKGAHVKIFSQYKDGGEFYEIAQIHGGGKKPRTFAAAVRRADYLRLRFKGFGQAEIYRLDIEYSQGSDKRGCY